MRSTDYASLLDYDKVAHNRDLYGRSDRERLRRINYTRAARGAPLVASLADVRLRRPMEAR